MERKPWRLWSKVPSTSFISLRFSKDFLVTLVPLGFPSGTFTCRLSFWLASPTLVLVHPSGWSSAPWFISRTISVIKEMLPERDWSVEGFAQAKQAPDSAWGCTSSRLLTLEQFAWGDYCILWFKGLLHHLPLSSQKPHFSTCLCRNLVLSFTLTHMPWCVTYFMDDLLSQLLLLRVQFSQHSCYTMSSQIRWTLSSELALAFAFGWAITARMFQCFSRWLCWNAALKQMYWVWLADKVLGGLWLTPIFHGQ